MHSTELSFDNLDDKNLIICNNIIKCIYSEDAPCCLFLTLGEIKWVFFWDTDLTVAD